LKEKASAAKLALNRGIRQPALIAGETMRMSARPPATTR
jgi:hypothetical protein